MASWRVGALKTILDKIVSYLTPSPAAYQPGQCKTTR
jgi:hypothetical protein